jgi:hypothetical protein
MVWMLVLAWVFLMLALALFIQARDYLGDNPILRQRLSVKEPFQTGGNLKVDDNIEQTKFMSGDPALNTPREPYNLLNGWLAPAETQMRPTAQKCHEVDFETRLEKTGNYIQRTNNYVHGDPDSCSAPTHELVLGFYKPEPLPFKGCAQPYVE